MKDLDQPWFEKLGGAIINGVLIMPKYWSVQRDGDWEDWYDERGSYRLMLGKDIAIWRTRYRVLSVALLNKYLAWANDSHGGFIHPVTDVDQLTAERKVAAWLNLHKCNWRNYREYWTCIG